MFKYMENTRTFWFSHLSIELESEYKLVGSVLGLAIYNGVILDLHFPPVVYKKLLAGKPDLQVRYVLGWPVLLHVNHGASCMHLSRTHAPQVRSELLTASPEGVVINCHLFGRAHVLHARIQEPLILLIRGVCGIHRLHVYTLYSTQIHASRN